jgi:hypothetical protein
MAGCRTAGPRPSGCPRTIDGVNLIIRAETVRKDLERYDPADFCPWPIGRHYNLIVEEARDLYPDDRYVQMADLLRPTEDNLCALPGGEVADCGSVRTMLGQIQNSARAARRSDGPGLKYAP